MVTNNRNRLVTVVNIVIVGIERERTAIRARGRKVSGMGVLPAAEVIANDGRSTVDG